MNPDDMTDDELEMYYEGLCAGELYHRTDSEDADLARQLAERR